MKRQIVKGMACAVVSSALALCVIAVPSFSQDANKAASSQDHRVNRVSKLDAAKRFVQKFLEDDADPKQVFFIRQITFPTWKDQPIRDCGFKSLVRWIEPREPYFEDAKGEVVVVPVWAEVLMVEAEGYDWGWGRDRAEDGKSWCKWEYERYNHATQTFEKLPSFRNQTYSTEFARWGESTETYLGSMQSGLAVAPGRYVAIAPDKRLVRYTIRVSVKREQPYRLAPQVPRHWYAQDAIAKLEMSIERQTLRLIAGVSDRESSATGEELQRDLQRMMHQREEKRWVVKKLREALAQPPVARSLSSVPNEGSTHSK